MVTAATVITNRTPVDDWRLREREDNEVRTVLRCRFYGVVSTEDVRHSTAYGFSVRECETISELQRIVVDGYCETLQLMSGELSFSAMKLTGIYRIWS